MRPRPLYFHILSSSPVVLRFDLNEQSCKITRLFPITCWIQNKDIFNVNITPKGINRLIFVVSPLCFFFCFFLFFFSKNILVYFRPQSGATKAYTNILVQAMSEGFSLFVAPHVLWLIQMELFPHSHMTDQLFA
jgi:hypothetical protein